MRRPHPSRRRHRGTAMTEALLIMPILLIVFAWLIYFGRGMVRAQHAAVIDRYEVWRQATRGTGPGANDDLHHPQLNETFFAGNASHIGSSGHHSFPSAAPQDQSAASYSKAYDTGRLTDAAFDRFEAGRSMRFSTNHAETVQVYQRFAGPIEHGFTRLGHDWRYANDWRDQNLPQWRYTGGGPAMYHPLRDVYFVPLDTQLEYLQNSGNHVARTLRELYLHRPPYRGPDVHF